MLRILHDTKYDFIRWWKVMAAITIAFIVLGLGSLAIKPLNLSIEFTGGTLLQLEFAKPPDVGEMRAALDNAGIHGAEIQQFGTNREFTIRAQEQAQVAAQASGATTIAQRIQSVLKQRFGDNNVTVKRTEAVGPRVGEELARGAVIAILLSFLITLVYLSIRFEWRFALAAVIATSHDVFTTVAFLKLMHLEISLTVVAGLLTVLGYSLNDTIIIFDRVRENLRKGRKESLYDTLNRSINETLPRSVMTHVTTFAATLALLLFAGEVIRPFAWVMAFGIVTGTFSSIYVAAPVLLWIERKWPRQTGGIRPSSSTATPTSRTRRSTATATT
ncbi:MAG TPA: protein translocase subunit SecF [Gemmatimonadaceae bacterium]|jgi:preprotein translocase subunit SecF|nr:protein translocase subunit SecF [Gemmatimonadaceae bacterium]